MLLGSTNAFILFPGLCFCKCFVDSVDNILKLYVWRETTRLNLDLHSSEEGASLTVSLLACLSLSLVMLSWKEVTFDECEEKAK